MKLDPKIIALFTFPIAAVFACGIMSFIVPEPKPFVLARPEFLKYIDQLGVSSGNTQETVFPESVRNVFSHETPIDEDPVEDTGYVIEESVAHPPVSVSMIVAGNAKSFSVINGKKMKAGESSGLFTLTAIQNNSVTIRYLDGIEETIHVKAY